MVNGWKLLMKMITDCCNNKIKRKRETKIRRRRRSDYIKKRSKFIQTEQTKRANKNFKHKKGKQKKAQQQQQKNEFLFIWE